MEVTLTPRFETDEFEEWEAKAQEAGCIITVDPDYITPGSGRGRKWGKVSIAKVTVEGKASPIGAYLHNGVPQNWRRRRGLLTFR
jgi:hypothetical protein